MNLPALLSAVLTCASAMLFALDSMGYFAASFESVATLVDARGSVRRMAREELTWDQAGVGAPLAASDTIATGELSAARIRFDAGGELDLNEGSMVVLNQSLDEIKLRFITGGGRLRVPAAAARKVTVEEPVRRDPASVPPPSRVEVEVVDLPQAAAPLAEPKVVEAPAPVAETEIRRPEAALSAQTEIQAIAALPSPPELVFPEDESQVSIPSNLSWKAPAGGQHEILIRSAETGETRMFRTSALEHPLPRLPSGRYEWGVRLVRPDGARSAVSAYRSFEVIASAAPAPEPVKAAPPRPVAKPAPAPKPKAPRKDDFKIFPVSVE